MKTRKESVEWYENQPDDVRVKLQDEFGQYGIPDRETKFFKWLKFDLTNKQETREMIEQVMKQQGL